MKRHPEFFRNHRRLPALAATLALHALLLLLWQIARQQPEATSDDAARIQWVNVAPQRPAAPPVAVAAAPVRKAKKRAPTPVAPAPAAAPAVAPVAGAEEALVAAPLLPSTSDMLQRARKDLAGIDKELRKDFPEARIKAPRNTPQVRLEKGIDLAYEMAPPKWYEQAKIKELSVPGSPGTRRYRIITARGTYCLTYPSNHSLTAEVMQQQGLGSKQHTITPQKSTCPIEF